MWSSSGSVGQPKCIVSRPTVAHAVYTVSFYVYIHVSYSVNYGSSTESFSLFSQYIKSILLTHKEMHGDQNVCVYLVTC